MHKILLVFANIIYCPFCLLLTVVFELTFPVLALFLMAFRKSSLHDVFRIHNWTYGRFMLKISWPFIRLEVSGKENIPLERPVMFVCNHQAFFDVLFTTVVPIPNTALTTKAWPFKLWGLKWYMRHAEYINLEQATPEDLAEKARKLLSRNVSLYFFPEGRRSPDGKLQRFKSGAFRIATENNIPVIPVCLEGVKKFQSDISPFFNPVKVRIQILSSVRPENFQGELRSLEMCRAVQQQFKEAMAKC